VRISPLSAILHPVIIMASMCACLLLLLLPTDEELPLVLYSRSCSFFLRLKIAQQKLCFFFRLPTPFVCRWEFVSSLCTAATMSCILLDRRLGSVAIFLSHAPRTFLFLLGLQPWNTEAHGV
jgi:hypothetical protein